MLVPLANNFAGLDRMTSGQNLPESRSSDTTDARSAGLRMGALGPRNGRMPLQRLTDSLKFLGQGSYNGIGARYQISALTAESFTGTYNPVADGMLRVTNMPWPGLPATVALPADFTTWDGVARTRFLQYKQRYYAFNGRNRMRDFDGTAWQFAGITKPVFTPGGTASAPAPVTDILSAVLSGTVVTVTTTDAHGYSAGDSVIIDVADQNLNGTFVIENVPTTTTFTYQIPTSVAIGIQSAVITAVERASQLTTITAPNHGFPLHAWVDFVVAAPPGFTFSGEVFATDVNTITTYCSVHDAVVSGDVSTVAVDAPSLATVRASGPTGHVASSALTVTSDVVTVTTPTAHGLKPGQYVSCTNFGNGGHPDLIAGVNVIASVPSSTTFTFAYLTDDISAPGTGPGYQFDVYSVGKSTPVIGSTGVYRYFVTACNSTHLDVQGRAIESIPSEMSDALGVANQTLAIANIPATHEDPQVDTWNVYRNKAGVYDSDIDTDQQDFFFIGSVPIGTTTFTDNVQDDALTGAYRLRFDQNIPPTFKYGAIYGDRMFGVGFDPITNGLATVNATPTLIDFSDVMGGTYPANIPDGARGAWFRVDGDVKQYRIDKVISGTQIQLDRAYVGALADAIFTIYRYPWEIYFSEFQDVEAWGPDGEGLRFMIGVPGYQEVTGLMEWQGTLLVFTHDQIYSITGKGPNLTDVRMLPDPLFNGLGAVAHDAICRVENDVHFLSSRGPAALTGSAAPQLIGVRLNTDWLDTLVNGELAFACMGTDDRDVYVSVPVHGDTVPLCRKTYRYERYTDSWWEETGLQPLCYIRGDKSNGQINVLTVLTASANGVVGLELRLNSGDFDIVGSQGGAFASHDSQSVTFTNPIFTTPVDGAMLRLYRGGATGVLVAMREVTGHSTTQLFWADAVTDDFDFAVMGNIPWTWLTKTIEVPGRLNSLDKLHVTFDVKDGTRLIKTDVVDGVENQNALSVLLNAKAYPFDVSKVSRDYACRLESRNGAVIRHVMAEGNAEADIKQ